MESKVVFVLDLLQVAPLSTMFNTRSNIFVLQRDIQIRDLSRNFNTTLFIFSIPEYVQPDVFAYILYIMLNICLEDWCMFGDGEIVLEVCICNEASRC